MQLKQLLLIGCAGLLGGLKVNAPAGFDSSYLTTYYEQKVSLFRLLPDTRNEIIFLGNSITDSRAWNEIWRKKM